MKHYLRKVSFTSSPKGSLFTNRDFVVAVGARTISLVGDIAALVALTLRTQPDGAWAVSALLIAGFLPLVVMTPIAGRLADRVDSRTLFAVAGLAQFAICLVLARIGAPAEVLGLVFLLGCGDAVTGATWTALLPGIVGEERLGAAIGIRQAAATAAGVAAPALGGLLTGIGGAALVLNLDAITFLAVGAAALLVRHRRGLTVSARTDADGLAGLGVIRRDPVLRGLIGALFVFCVVAGMANVISVFLIRQTLHASTTWFGVEAAVSSAAMTGAALLFGRSHSRFSGLPRLIVLGLVGMAGMSVACIGYGAAPSHDLVDDPGGALRVRQRCPERLGGNGDHAACAGGRARAGGRGDQRRDVLRNDRFDGAGRRAGDRADASRDLRAGVARRRSGHSGGAGPITAARHRTPARRPCSRTPEMTPSPT